MADLGRGVQGVGADLWTAATDPGRRYGVGVRWDALFADMEARLDAAAAVEQAEQVADLTRAERATVTLAARLRAQDGGLVELLLRSGDRVGGAVTDVGSAWLLLADGPREHLVPTASVVAVSLGQRAAPEDGSVLRRLGLGHAFRAIARDRTLVRVATCAGQWLGRVDAVGADHLDLALVRDGVRPLGRPLSITFASIDVVTSG